MKLRTKREKIVAACVIAAVFAAASCLCRPVFYLNDDVTIRSILSGSYTGVPDAHGVYMKYPLTLVLSLLYRFLGGIPWLELFFAGCLIWSVAEISCFVATTRSCFIFKVLAGALFVLPFFLYMHYTVIAAVLAGTAAFLLCTGRDGEKASLFWLLAWTVRSQVAYLALPFMGVALLWCLSEAEWKQQPTITAEGIKKSEESRIKPRKILMRTGLCLGIGLVLCMGWNHLAYSGREWRSYLEYNEARTKLYDYTDFLSTDYYGKHFDQYGMTEQEYLVLNSYNTLLDKTPDGEKLSQVAEIVADRNEQERDALLWIKECVRQYYYQIRYGDHIYGILWLFVCGCLGVMLVYRRAWLKLLLLACLEGGRSLIWVFLIWQGRFPERVSLSLYVMELLLLIGMVGTLTTVPAESGESEAQNPQNGKKRNHSYIAKKTVQTVLCLGVICLLGIQVRTDLSRQQNQVRIQGEWEILEEYCADHPETLYLLDVFSAVEYGGLQYEKDVSNMMLAGGWMSASPLADRRFAGKGVSDGGQALYEGADTVFLSEKDRDTEWLEQYLQERFGPCSLELTGEILCSEDKIFAEYTVVGLASR